MPCTAAAAADDHGDGGVWRWRRLKGTVSVVCGDAAAAAAAVHGRGRVGSSSSSSSPHPLGLRPGTIDAVGAHYSLH
jgi:hypothetical protein